MKKVLIIPVLLCYLAVTCGVMVNFHYCMDRLASTQLYSSIKTECDKCGMHMDDAHGCCRDEVQVVKVNDDHQPTMTSDLTIPSLEPVFQVPSEFLATSFYNFQEPVTASDHSPPIPIRQDICVEISVFRI
ncbi:MAG: hypothetical protein ABWZ25_16775 [Chitinophagaceae bacterium]